MISLPRLTAAARPLSRAAGRVLGRPAEGPHAGLAVYLKSGRHLGLAGIGLVVAAALLPAVTSQASASQAPASQAASPRTDETTISQGNLRTNWDLAEPTLTPGNVSGQAQGYQFGQVFDTAVTGQVYAQPLVVGSTVIVATEEDYVYGLNAATGAVEWTTQVGTPYAITGCGDLTPYVGVTSTPVYDPKTGDVYLVAQVMQGSNPAYEMFGIKAGTGAVVFTRSISGAASNDPDITFNATNELARPGLLLLNGWIYAAFGSHCDHNPYVGFVDGVKLSTGALTQWSDETGVSDNQAGIWQSGGGLMSDQLGRLFVTSGNGISPAAGPGGSPPGQLAESVIRLSTLGNATLAARSFFSPANAPALDAGDIDFGSGGPVGLPFGTSRYPSVLAQAGKDGRIFLLNRNSLGGREQGGGQTDNALSVTGHYKGQFGHPAAFGDTTTLTAGNAAAAHDYLYYLGANDSLRVLKAGVNGSGDPTLSDVANSNLEFGNTSGSPAVTSTGTDISTAVVWVVHSPSGSGSGGALEAFAADPGSGCTAAAQCTISPLWSALIGTAGKFSSVATSGGMVYVGTRGGQVYGFGDTMSAGLASGRRAATFQAPVGATSAAQDVTVTATSHVTVTGVTADTTATSDATVTDQFGLGTVTLTPRGSSPTSKITFPVTLRKGDRLTARVRFSPTAPGGTTGSVSFATRSHSSPAVTVPLSAAGTTGGLYASPTELPFALVTDTGAFASNVPVGVQVSREVDIINGSRHPETITSVRRPSAPYSVTGLPAIGTVVRPGQSIVVQVLFAPARPGDYPGSLSITGSGGATTTVDLSGTGLSARGLFSATPTSVNFGTVPVGRKVTKIVTLTNTGNEPATVTTATTLNSPFADRPNVTAGLPVNAGYDVRIPVTFTPAKKGTFTSSYRLTWTDVTGVHIIVVHITGQAG